MTDLKIVNAPAGSGKSTEIKKRVNEWATSYPLDKLLCVTYTNRAADELKDGISSPNVEISTIHSFMSSFSKSLFSAPEVVALYFEIYGERIRARIENIEGKEDVEESNARYREQLGDPLTFELVASSISSLYYNERSFNTLYRGGLCHDDLLSFIGECAKRHPAIYKRIGSKYHQVIIDEYQDTDVNVLEFFLSATDYSEFSLHLYGDRMQQIYESSPLRFQEIIQQFDIEEREVVNFRSTPEIVTVLNEIYNDKLLHQVAKNEQPGSVPRVHITNDPKSLEAQLSDADTLILSVNNSTIYGSIGSLELLKALQAMPEHGFNSRYSAVSLLSEMDWEKVQNPAIKLLYGLLELKAFYEKGHYGSVIKLLRKNRKDFGSIALSSHADKTRLSRELDSLFTIMRGEESTIGQVLEQLGALDIQKAADMSGYLEQTEYSQLLEVPFVQVQRSFQFRSDPKRSTQHGVKGESHEKVIFVAENSTRVPIVHMKPLFNLWPHHMLNLETLETFLAQASNAFERSITAIGEDPSKLKAATFNPIESAVTAQAQAVADEFSSLPLFQELYGDAYSKYLTRPGVTNAKSLFKLTPVEGLLSAYRLFYVGCSRAKHELDVIIPNNLLTDTAATEKKLSELGFEIKLYE